MAQLSLFDALAGKSDFQLRFLSNDTPCSFDHRNRRAKCSGAARGAKVDGNLLARNSTNSARQQLRRRAQDKSAVPTAATRLMSATQLMRLLQREPLAKEKSVSDCRWTSYYEFSASG